MTNYEIFCKTVELGSLSKSAEALDYSQPNVSHAIQQLERDFGFQLLIRNKGGVSLTENGEIIYEKMKQILEAEYELKKCVNEINGFTLGRIKIGVFSSIAAEILPRALKSFNEKYPNVEITLYDGDHKAVQEWLMNGTVDIGFLSQIPDKTLEFIPIFEDEMLAILPSNHPAASLTSIPVDFFANEPTIYPYKTISHDVDVIMNKYGIEVNKKMEVKGGETIVAMIKEGLGVGILPELYIRNHHDGIVARPLSNNEYRTIGVAISPRSNNTYLTQRFLETVHGTNS